MGILLFGFDNWLRFDDWFAKNPDSYSLRRFPRTQGKAKDILVRFYVTDQGRLGVILRLHRELVFYGRDDRQDHPTFIASVVLRD